MPVQVLKIEFVEHTQHDLPLHYQTGDTDVYACFKKIKNHKS